MDVRVVRLKGGQLLATCGAWLLVRRELDGKSREICQDAPCQMMYAAHDAIADVVEGRAQPARDYTQEA